MPGVPFGVPVVVKLSCIGMARMIAQNGAALWPKTIS